MLNVFKTGDWQSGAVRTLRLPTWLAVILLGPASSGNRLLCRDLGRERTDRAERALHDRSRAYAVHPQRSGNRPARISSDRRRSLSPSLRFCPGDHRRSGQAGIGLRLSAPGPAGDGRRAAIGGRHGHRRLPDIGHGWSPTRRPKWPRQGVDGPCPRVRAAEPGRCRPTHRGSSAARAPRRRAARGRGGAGDASSPSSP